MNIHVDRKNVLNIPFDENQTVGVKKSGLKHGLQEGSNAGFPVKAKGLGGSAVKKQRTALRDVSQSQINARRQSSKASSDQKGSKLNVSVTKPANKCAAPKIFVEETPKSEFSDNNMACSGIAGRNERDLYAAVEEKAINRFSSCTPGLIHPSKYFGNVSDLPSPTHDDIKEEAAAIVNEMNIENIFKSDEDKMTSSNSFLSGIFDDQSINDLLND